MLPPLWVTVRGRCVMAWIWLLWALGWVAAVDCLRRPHLQWVAADRQRAFWVVMLIFLGPLMVWIYLIGVLPRLNSASGAAADDQRFRKAR